ncbi:MAG TPA: sigma-54 dependent transcriptional regulator [Candidatus Syntrophosphaera sp.]|nr:sigma-54 dependent transcriptional regulator [Candidatus Syntrophosphaera sp.]
MDEIRILLVDDDATFCALTSDLLRKHGFIAETALNTLRAREILAQGTFDILMLDLCVPALQDGFGLLDEVRAKYPNLLVLMISGEGNISDAVHAIKNGASDFIEKPIEPEHLLVRIQNLSERIRGERQLKKLEQSAIGMVGVSDAMKKVFGQIVSAAGYDLPVLITGETGVGKELASRAVHRLSKFGGRDMVSINCASVPRDLFEAELFGYEKGAFTGAVNSYKGYFEFARNTSFFLDEISELPIDVQAKLLRVLSEGEIQRIGSKVGIADTRIISASNQDLQAAVQNGRFREALFYRLNSIRIHIPPLRQHSADIVPLAGHFINDFCQRQHTLPKEISPRAQVWLTEQKWEGNARELKNCVERAMICSQRSVLEADDFLILPGGEEADTTSEGTLRDSLRKYETHLIREHLKANGFNISQTAKQLGMDKSNLCKRIRALGISLQS